MKKFKPSALFCATCLGAGMMAGISSTVLAQTGEKSIFEQAGAQTPQTAKDFKPGPDKDDLPVAIGNGLNDSQLDQGKLL